MHNRDSCEILKTYPKLAHRLYPSFLPEARNFHQRLKVDFESEFILTTFSWWITKLRFKSFPFWSSNSRLVIAENSDIEKARVQWLKRLGAVTRALALFPTQWIEFLCSSPRPREAFPHVQWFSILPPPKTNMWFHLIWFNLTLALPRGSPLCEWNRVVSDRMKSLNVSSS